jgi:hypothetical protein
MKNWFSARLDILLNMLLSRGYSTKCALYLLKNLQNKIRDPLIFMIKGEKLQMKTAAILTIIWSKTLDPLKYSSVWHICPLIQIKE